MSSNKILRVGFAMGGGSFLGTFQGSALAEALKLLILRGGYKEETENGEEWKSFDRVEVDVFSV